MVLRHSSPTHMHHILTLTCSRRLSVRDPLVFLWLSRRLPSSSCSLVWFSNLSFSAEFKTSCSFSFITLAPTIFSIKACCAALHCVMPTKGGQVAQTIMTIRETMDHSARRAIIQLQVLWAELDLAILRKTQTKATVCCLVWQRGKYIWITVEPAVLTEAGLCVVSLDMSGSYVSISTMLF